MRMIFLLSLLLLTNSIFIPLRILLINRFHLQIKKKNKKNIFFLNKNFTDDHMRRAITLF